MTSRRANGEGSIFPYRTGFAAYVWITTQSGKRQRRYVWGRTRKLVHSRWVELTRKAERGPVVTRVPTVAQFLHRWFDETVAPNLAPLVRDVWSHVKNYIEPGIGSLRLDRLRVTDVQAGSIASPHNASAARSGSAVIGWRPRAQSRTSGPSCVQRCTRQSVKN